MAAIAGFLDRLRRHGRHLALALAAVVLVEWGHGSGWLAGLDNLYADAWQRLAGQRAGLPPVALVMVDQAALDAHPDEPMAFWGPHFAQAVERLHQLGVTVVGLDFLLAVSPDHWLAGMGDQAARLARFYDAGLRNQIAQGKVILAASRMVDGRTGQAHYLLPHSDYLMAMPGLDLAGHLGLVDVASDQDGVVRHFTSRFPARPDPTLEGLELPELSLPAMLARRHLERLGRPADLDLAAGERRLVYFGPPGSLPRVSMSRLAASDFARDPQLQSLKGRAVLIGAGYPGMGDLHFTPYATGPGANRGRLMAGVELHGHALANLLAGIDLRQPGQAARLAGSLVLVGLVLAALLRLELLAGSLAGLALLVAGPVLGYLMFRQDWLISAASWQGSVLLAGLGGYALKYTGESRQRLHMARLFSRYVSEAAVQVLLKSERMPDLGGELKQVTVLFSDIRNFTTISEILQPAEVVEMLNTYFERQCEVILAEGGSIDKFIGDAVMAEFGAPLPAADHPAAAVRAALRMVAEAEAFRDWMAQRFPGRGLPPFAIGVGLHTGPAIIGSIGSRKRSEYTAIGDTVNVASRLEGATKELGAPIAASAAVVAACNGEVQVGRTRVLTVKGHREPVEVFEILAMERKQT